MLMGFEGKFYVGPAGCTSPTDTQMMLAVSIRNPKYEYTYSDVDVTTRKHAGNKAYMKGMLDISISFTLPNYGKDNPTDAALILESLRSRKMPLTIIMLDEEGGEGIMGDFELFSGSKTEEDENAQEFEIEAKPSAAGRKVEWYKPTP